MKRTRAASLLATAAALALAALACGPTTEVPPPPPEALPTLTPTPQAAGGTGDTSSPATDTPTPEGCSLDSGYVADVSIPDDTPFPPGTPFTKTWRIKNTGTCDWEAGTQFVYYTGDAMGGPVAIDIPPLAVGASVDLSVDFVSPGDPGTYRCYYQVQDPDGQRFGQQYYVQIVVVEPTGTPTNTPPATDTPPAATDTPAPTSAPVTAWSTYRAGDTGPAVAAIQYLLRAEGATLSADGSFGNLTTAAVKAFQTSQGLAADGIVGPDTWTALVSNHTVQQGSSGDAVRAVQHLLKHAHGHDIPIDGSFGNLTTAAVKAFQAAHGLAADGIVGQNTWKNLTAK